MSPDRETILADLKAFLRTVQKPNRPVDSVGENDGLVASGLIESLAIVQIVAHLETRYGIDFSAAGVDPERFASMASIADLIMEKRS
jgi:acyl carrier protein